jgi:hypothetical protein
MFSAVCPHLCVRNDRVTDNDMVTVVKAGWRCHSCEQHVNDTVFVAGLLTAFAWLETLNGM